MKIIIKNPVTDRRKKSVETCAFDGLIDKNNRRRLNAQLTTFSGGGEGRRPRVYGGRERKRKGRESDRFTDGRQSAAGGQKEIFYNLNHMDVADFPQTGMQKSTK